MGGADVNLDPAGTPPTAAELSQAASVTGFRKMGLRMQYYVALESTWHVLLYAGCYRYRPTVLLLRYPRAQALLTRVGEWFKRRNFKTASSMGSRMYQSDWARALAEWTIINKVLAPVSFPAKIYVAHVLAKRTQSKILAKRTTEIAPEDAGHDRVVEKPGLSESRSAKE